MSVPIVQITESATIVCKGEQDQIVTVESWRRRNGDVGVCIKAKFLDGSESREIVIFDPPASKAVASFITRALSADALTLYE